MKYININRTNEECLQNVIKYAKKNEYINNLETEIKKIKNIPIKEIRYIDNNYRIYEARKNWKRLFVKVVF